MSLLLLRGGGKIEKALSLFRLPFFQLRERERRDISRSRKREREGEGAVLIFLKRAAFLIRAIVSRPVW